MELYLVMCRLNVGLLESAIKHWQDCVIEGGGWRRSWTSIILSRAQSTVMGIE